jgi:hypothetical protein
MVKAYVIGAIVGALVVAIVGFVWGGWVIQSTSERLGAERVDAALTSALTPICVDRAVAEPELFDELADITSAFERRGFVERAGWATPPDRDQPHRGIATACAAALDVAARSRP